MISKIKKAGILLLATAVVFGLTSCSKKEETKPAEKQEAATTAEAEKSAETPAASDFPKKKVTIIMPWSVGGGPDTIARKVASYGEKYLGVPVIVENHTGGAGTIAMNKFFSESADGYTMIVANGPLFSLTPSFIEVDYKLEQISPLIGMRQVEFVILSNSKSEIKTLDDLKKFAEAGNVVKYATTGGPGNDSYTMISVLFKKLGIQAEAVPYDGGQDAINALAGGHVDIAIGSPPVYREYVKNGEFNCLGTFIPDGIDVEGIGNIPSFKSQGLEAQFIGMDYFAVKSDVDAEKQEVLKNFIKQVYADEEFKTFMKEMGMVAWEAEKDAIIGEINQQTEDMKEYIELLK